MRLKQEFAGVRYPSAVIREAIGNLRGFAPQPLPDPRPSNSFDLSRGAQTWYLDDEDEWFSEYDLGSDGAYLQCWFAFCFGIYISVTDRETVVEVTAPKRGNVLSVMQRFVDAHEEYRLPEEPPPVAEPLRVFIGHGGASSDWMTIKNSLQDQHGYSVVAYETGARAGHSIRDVLASMGDASTFAVLVMTAEDQTADGSIRARQNVVHETGLFQGRLGYNRAIAVVEEGVELFSNLDGVQQIRYEAGHVRETLGDILATLRREYPHLH